MRLSQGEWNTVLSPLAHPSNFSQTGITPPRIQVNPTPTSQIDNPSTATASAPRMLVDTNKRDTKTEIFGRKVSASIGFAPIGINKIYNPPGELLVTKVARELNLPYCLSTAGSNPIEDVGKANGDGPRFF